MAGELRDGRGVPKRRVFGYYAVVYITSGYGRFADDTGFSCALRPGNLLILFPELGHTYGPTHGEYWDKTFIVWSWSMFMDT